MSTEEKKDKDELNEDSAVYLKKILDVNKKRLFWTRISVALVAVLVVAFVSVVPFVIGTLLSAQNTLTNVNSAITQAQGIMTDLSTTVGSLETTIGDVSKLVGDSSKNLTEAFNKINSVDFEGLNKAIEDLGAVVEPLNEMVNGKKK